VATRSPFTQDRGALRGPQTIAASSRDVATSPDGLEGGWYWRSDADGVATWGPTSRPVPQWTRPGATPVATLGRQGHH
jgi:hypothetical protein